MRNKKDENDRLSFFSHPKGKEREGEERKLTKEGGWSSDVFWNLKQTLLRGVFEWDPARIFAWDPFGNPLFCLEFPPSSRPARDQGDDKEGGRKRKQRGKRNE